MVLVLIYLQDYLYFQLFFFNFSALARLIYVGWSRPLKDKQVNTLLVFGEVIVLLTNYHLLCFTDWAPDPFGRHIMGYSLIGVTLFGIVVYLVAIEYNPFLLAIYKSRLYYGRFKKIRKHKKF
jgi:hypothetical protein